LLIYMVGTFSFFVTRLGVWNNLYFGPPNASLTLTAARQHTKRAGCYFQNILNRPPKLKKCICENFHCAGVVLLCYRQIWQQRLPN